MTYAQQIGARIAFLRRLKGLTLAELAERVNKHKSTISKYESGQIIIDIESLKEEADALGVDVAQIVEMPNTSRLTSAPIGPHNPFCLASTFYMYYFDGRSARLVSSVICLTSRHDGDNRINASLYMDTPDPQNYLNCRYFYSGYMYPYDLTSFFIFENQAIHIEKLSLMAVHSFSDKNRFWGAFMGLSPQPFGPMIAKVLIANSMVPQEQLRQTDFKISRDEWKAFQRYNSMLLLLENNS